MFFLFFVSFARAVDEEGRDPLDLPQEVCSIDVQYVSIMYVQFKDSFSLLNYADVSRTRSVSRSRSVTLTDHTH